MKIITKTENITKKESSPNGETMTTSYEVPNRAFATIATIITILTGLATALGTYWGNQSKHNSDESLIGIREKYFKVLVLERFLEEADESERGRALSLLLASGIIDDSSESIKEIICKHETPKLKVHEDVIAKYVFGTISGGSLPSTVVGTTTVDVSSPSATGSTKPVAER